MFNKINVPLDEFIRPFFDATDTIHIRVFDDRKSGADGRPSAFKGQKLSVEAGKINTLAETLHKHNALNRGIFFVVNGGGDRDEEIERVNAQFVEMDEASFEEQEARINAFPLQPSLVVRTRKSYHCYWLIKGKSDGCNNGNGGGNNGGNNDGVSRFRHIQKQLVARFDGDPMCVNESRVMRLPGFNHCKQEPVEVVCVLFAPERRYTQGELSVALPYIPRDETQHGAGGNKGGGSNVGNNGSNGATYGNGATAPKGSRKGLTQVGRRCDFIQYCKANAATLPEGLWYSMISNLAVFDGGDKVIHALSKPYQDYSYAETQEKINHFLESGTKPMTCAKIAECGFNCPRLSSGGCDCKSPAALAFKPLSSAELLEYLNNVDIPTAPLDKIAVALNFIKENLYNIEPATAETLINYDLKSKFDFKDKDLRPLLAAHKECWKKYSDSKETRRERDGAGLPDWYEINERGGVKFMPGVLADYMAGNIAAFFGAGSYYFYERGVYETREDLAAFAAVRSFMNPRNSKSAEIADAEKQWRSAIRKQVREINANPFIINVRNGLYNVLDETFKPHTDSYYSTVQINANFDPNAECPQFLDFLSGILPDTEHALMQEIFGYLLIPVNKAQKSFVFVGAPNAGKSTLLSIAQEVLLGEDNVSNIPWQALGDRFNKAELFGKLANVFADLPSKAIDDNGMFKSLTGEDYVTAERKNKDPFNFKPYARLLFSCNDMPKNYADRSEGFYRRLVIIRFDKSVPADKRDPNLRERMSAERDGILSWALDGLRRLIANNYQFSETSRTRSELQRYKVESNSALMFLEECCELGNDFECVRETLFERYCDYCRKNGFKSMSQTNFNRDVEGAGEGIERGLEKVSRRKTWKGVRLAE